MKPKRRLDRPPSRQHFQRAGAIAGGMAGGALLIGMCGYHFINGEGWVDSFLDASMILGGMGPVDQLENDGAKLFAAVYALFSGLFFVAVMGVVIAPWVHRMIHVMHADEEQ